MFGIYCRIFPRQLLLYHAAQVHLTPNQGHMYHVPSGRYSGHVFGVVLKIMTANLEVVLAFAFAVNCVDCN